MKEEKLIFWSKKILFLLSMIRVTMSRISQNYWTQQRRTELASVINVWRKFDGCCCFIYLPARLRLFFGLPNKCRAVVNVAHIMTYVTDQSGYRCEVLYFCYIFFYFIEILEISCHKGLIWIDWIYTQHSSIRLQ